MKDNRKVLERNLFTTMDKIIKPIIKPTHPTFSSLCLGPSRKCLNNLCGILLFLLYSNNYFFCFVQWQLLRGLTNCGLEGWTVHLWLCLGFDSWNSHTNLTNEILAFLLFLLNMLSYVSLFSSINHIIWITIILFVDFHSVLFILTLFPSLM